MPERFDQHAELIDSSALPTETIEAAIDALGFAQGFHALMQDMGLIQKAREDVDVGLLEACFDALMGEFQAACICLATFKDSEQVLLKTYENCRDKHTSQVSALVINGYKKLAERVVNTREAMTPRN